MISKRVFMIFCGIIQITLLYSQSSDIQYDINGFPVYARDSNYHNNAITYYPVPIPIDASINVAFKGDLTAYFDSCYYHRSDYNYEELNEMVTFTVLFDKKLNIKEVRIIRSRDIDYYSEKYNYNYRKLIERILWSTQGKWIITSPIPHNWYVCIAYVKLK